MRTKSVFVFMTCKIKNKKVLTDSYSQWRDKLFKKGMFSWISLLKKGSGFACYCSRTETWVTTSCDSARQAGSSARRPATLNSQLKVMFHFKRRTWSVSDATRLTILTVKSCFELLQHILAGTLRGKWFKKRLSRVSWWVNQTIKRWGLRAECIPQV